MGGRIIAEGDIEMPPNKSMAKGPGASRKAPPGRPNKKVVTFDPEAKPTDFFGGHGEAKAIHTKKDDGKGHNVAERVNRILKQDRNFKTLDR